MKKYIFAIFSIFALQNVVFAQEEMGEGDMFVKSEEYKDAEVVSETKYIVADLFTRMPLEQIKQKAKTEQKGYYIDFTASWCNPCKLMDQTTFRDYEVVKYTKENFYAAQLDMSDFDAIEMQAMYSINALPTILFFSPEGKLIGRATGLQTGSLFLQKLKEIKKLL